MITVAPARADQCSAALVLLFARHPAAERLACVRDVLDAQQRGEIRLDGLLLAEENGKAVGAALYVLQPDNTAFVWPPVCARDDGTQPIRDALYAELCRRADAADAWLSQCLVEVDDSAEREALDRNGFSHLADLSYMERLLELRCPAARGLNFRTTTYDPSNRERFASVLEHTYRDSHDCPGLSGKRTAIEALASHQTVGSFDPLRWKLYEIDGRDVGVLLINDHPDQDALEVVYMGVVPEARGHGFSREMLLDGIREAQTAGRRSLLLAVDRRNTFARNVYEDLGFREIDVRSVHVRAHPSRRGCD
ncbi:MAG: GNAT family N-acetyltransferase [Planctomycetaceae bacterium]